MANYYPSSICKELVLNRFPLPNDYELFLQSKCKGIEYVRRGQAIVTNNHILGRDVEIRQLRSNTNIRKHGKTFYVVTMLCDENRIEEQTHVIAQRFERLDDDVIKERFTIELLNMKIFKDNQVIKIKSTYDYQTGKNGYIEGTNPVGNSMGYYPPIIHDYNDYSVLVNSEMKYTNIWQLKYCDLAKSYKYRKLLEMLYKNGLKSLWEDVAKGQADMRKLTKKMLIKNRQMLRQLNPDYRQLSWLTKMLAFGYKPTVQLMEMIDKWNDSELDHRIETAKKYQLDPKEFMNYLDKQDETARHYCDYRSMLEQLKTPASTHQTIYPKDLKLAHDDAVNKFNAIKQEVNNQAYKKRLNKLKKLEYRNDYLAIIVPTKLEEILDEGKKLNHCVGSYIDKVKDGKTTILFVRKLDELESPYYTMEFKNNEIIQCRGNKNQKAPDEIQQFTQEWRKWLKRNSQKKSASVERSAAA